MKSSGDWSLAITADIPLAAELIAKGGFALNPRGELYIEANIRERLKLRDFMEALRASGIHTGGPNALSQRDRQAFSNALDRFLTRATVGRAELGVRSHRKPSKAV